VKKRGSILARGVLQNDELRLGFGERKTKRGFAFGVYEMERRVS
jgi:hypothetical protein